MGGMPRGNRVVLGRNHGGVLHVTHRCHDRAFLVKFQQDVTRIVQGFGSTCGKGIE
jgi:hypothetical protein